MPNLQNIQKDLDKFEKISSQLRNGKSIEVDGQLYSPILKDGDTDDDLASCGRMIKRLTVRLQSAKDQALMKGMDVIGKNGKKHVKLASGAPALAHAMSLTGAEIQSLIATDGDIVSKRDVRVYARAKEDGDIEGYFRKALKRSGVKCDSEAEFEELVLDAMSFETVSKKVEKDEGPKALKDMSKAELQAECGTRGLVKKGTVKVLLKRIRKFDKDAEKVVEVEKEEEVDQDETPDEPAEEKSDINPLA